MISLALFPIFAQAIFVGYLFALTAVLFIASKPKSEILNLYLAFVLRWSAFIFFTILSLIYLPENTLVAIFLLIYFNTTFNPKFINT